MSWQHLRMFFVLFTNRNIASINPIMATQDQEQTYYAVAWTIHVVRECVQLFENIKSLPSYSYDILKLPTHYLHKHSEKRKRRVRKRESERTRMIIQYCLSCVNKVTMRSTIGSRDKLDACWRSIQPLAEACLSGGLEMVHNKDIYRVICIWAVVVELNRK